MRKASDLTGNPLANAGTAGVDNAIGRYTQGWVSPVGGKPDPTAQKFDDINTRLDSMQPTSQRQPAQAAPVAAAAPALPAPSAPNPLAQTKPRVGSVRITTPRPQGFRNLGIHGPQAPASLPAAPKPPAVTGAQSAAPRAPRISTGQGKARIQAGITQKLGIPRTANAAAGVASSVLRLRRALSNASS